MWKCITSRNEKENGINLKEAMMQEESHRDVVTKTQESSSKKVQYSKNMEKKRGESQEVVAEV